MTLLVWALEGIGEVAPGADLAATIIDQQGERPLMDGDIVLVTSKVVSKAEGRVRFGDRESALVAETVRVVARRGPTQIVRNRLGLTMAAAGIDASNVARGSIVLLPLDPDGSAQQLRAALGSRTGANVAVIITDTAGRAWREGQTDIAIGAAGITVAEDFSGREDGYGNPLAVTLPAVADELAGAAELVQGKLGGRPVAVVRGRADLVLPPGVDGPGARSLQRAEGSDLFGYGAREAVLRALGGRDDDRPPFGAPVALDELIVELTDLCRTRLGARTEAVAIVGTPNATDPVARLRTPTIPDSVIAAACFALGWVVIETSCSPGSAVDDGPDAGLEVVVRPVR